MKSFFSRVGKAVVTFLWRRWAETALVVLGLLVLGVGYQMWKARLPAAMVSLPRLLIYLSLMALVVFVKYASKGWAQSLIEKGKSSLRQQISHEVSTQSKSYAQTTLQKGTEGAKQALTSVKDEVEEDLDRLFGNKARSPQIPARLQVAQRCPACGRIVRARARFCDGCGQALSFTCSKCGRKLRPAAKFCDGCGTPARRTR